MVGIAGFTCCSSGFSGVFDTGFSSSWNATEERLNLPTLSLNDARRGKGLGCSSASSGVFDTGSSISWNGTEDRLNFPKLSLNDARRCMGLRGLSLTTRFASLRGDTRWPELFNDNFFSPKLCLKRRNWHG